MDHVVFLSVAEVLRIHRRIIADFGGEDGLRDRGLLESAVAMPHAMFDGAFLHPDLATMAAAYHFHLCANHPFVDGNKRVAVAAAEIFLLANGATLDATDDELEQITLGVANAVLGKGDVITFFQAHTT
jgi:death-on-curing protein